MPRMREVPEKGLHKHVSETRETIGKGMRFIHHPRVGRQNILHRMVQNERVLSGCGDNDMPTQRQMRKVHGRQHSRRRFQIG